jgi:hypothetical protein
VRSSDGFCRVDFASGHPGKGKNGSGPWNLPMAHVTVLKNEIVDPRLFKVVRDEDGSPLRDFEVGGHAKVNEPKFLDSSDGQQGLDALFGVHPPGLFDFDPPSPTRKPEESAAMIADAEVSAVFEILKVGLPDQCHEAAMDQTAPTSGNMVWQPRQNLVPEDSTPGDFVVVKSLSADAEDLLPFKADTFASDLSALIKKPTDRSEAAMRPRDFLAKFGIYHKDHLLIVASNQAHQIGDMAFAMTSLRDRISPDAQPKPAANVADSSQAIEKLEPEPEREPEPEPEPDIEAVEPEPEPE